MSVTSGFFNSLNGDRKYSAEQLSELFNNLITDGVFGNVGNAFAVSADTGNNITVGIGRSWFDSVWLYNDSLLPISLDAPEVVVSRIDAVVIEVDKSEGVRAGAIKVLKGTPASNPSKPVMAKTETLTQYPIAYINRRPNAPSISQADITYSVGTSECPIVTGILDVMRIDDIVAQWQSQFNTWFDALDASLSGDVAANLAAQILDIYSKFDDLATSKSVYIDLEDSTGDTIKDSNGNTIEGRVAFSEDGVKDVTIIENGGSSTNNVDPYEIGDIRITSRTDIGEDWLLCNGDSIDSSLYPKLGSLMEQSITDMSSWRLDTWGDPDMNVTMLEALAYYDGIYLCGGYAGLYISNNPSNGWTVLSSDTTGITDQIKTLACYDGIWVALTKGEYGTYTTKIYTTRNPNGKWTKNSYELPFHYDTKVDIAYYDGVWVAVGRTENMNDTMYYTGNPDKSWGYIPESNTGIPGNSIYTICCHDGTWAAVDTSYQVWYVNGYPDDKWQSGETLQVFSIYEAPYNIKFCGGFWAVGYDLNTTLSGYYSYIAITDDIETGIWEYVQTGNKGVKGFTYCKDGLLIAVERNGLLRYYDTLTNIDLDSTLPTNIQYYAIVTQVENFNGCIIAIGSKAYNLTGDLREEPAIWTFKSSALPLISLDKAYAYIKAY